MARRVPYVPQMELADCGAACLAMVLGLHGRRVPYDEIRASLGVGRDGIDAQTLIEAAGEHGLIGRGVQAGLDDLVLLPAGSILHWGFDHFVVLDRVRRRGAWIVDPGVGRLWVPFGAMSRSFTGVALLFEPGESFAPADAARRPALRHLRPLLAQTQGLAQIAATSLLLRVFALALPLLIAVVIGGVIPTGDTELLTMVAAALGVVVAYNLVGSFLRAHLLLRMRARLDLSMTLGFVDHLVQLPYAFFMTRASGDLVMRLRSTAAVREIVTAGALSAIIDGTFATLYLALLVALSPPLALLVAVLGMLQVGVLLLARRRTQRLMAAELEIEAASQNYAFHMLAGMETLKAAGAERRSTERWANLFVQEVNVALDRGRLSAAVEAAMGTLRLASPLVVIVLGASLVADGRLELATMLAAAALATGFLEPLAALVAAGLEVQMLGSYLARLNDVLDTPREQQGVRTIRPGDLRGEIRAEKVSFAYSPRSAPVLLDVSVEVEPGQQVALVGPSGSGKSTLGRLLIGLYPPTGGRVLLDGMDAASLSARLVRPQLGVVTQDAHLFSGSIRENIALSLPDATDEDLVRAAELACIHDDIVAMPMGYETVLVDRGASLSGGQRQRIALARALVHRPRILLLDEGTSALDSPTERRVYEHISSLDCTVVQIAHRMSTVLAADQILVLDGGRVVERGTHRDLIEAGGAYHALVRPQGADEARSER